MLCQSRSMDFDSQVSFVQWKFLEPVVEKSDYHRMNLTLKEAFFGVSDPVYSSTYLLQIIGLLLFFFSTSLSCSFLIISVAILFTIDFNNNDLLFPLIKNIILSTRSLLSNHFLPLSFLKLCQLISLCFLLFSYTIFNHYVASFHKDFN